MRYCFIFCVTILFSTLINAQSAADSAGVRKAANDYIEGFYFGDTAKLHYSIDTNASKHGYAKSTADTSYRKVSMTFSQMIQYSKNEKNRVTEDKAKIRNVEILDMQSKIAAVKVRAWWGIDYLLLTKIQDRWVIEKVLWQSL